MYNFWIINEVCNLLFIADGLARVVLFILQRSRYPGIMVDAFIPLLVLETCAWFAIGLAFSNFWLVAFAILLPLGFLVYCQSKSQRIVESFQRFSRNQDSNVVQKSARDMSYFTFAMLMSNLVPVILYCIGRSGRL